KIWRWDDERRRATLVEATFLERVSEIELQAQLREARRHLRRRSEPRAAGDERLVVAQDRRGVQQVVDVDADRRPRASEPEDLAQPEIDFVDAIAVEDARLDDVDGDVWRAARERPSQLRLDDGVGDRVVGGQRAADTRGRAESADLDARLAGVRHARLHVDLRDDVAGDQLVLREVPRLDVAERVERRELRKLRADLAGI